MAASCGRYEAVEWLINKCTAEIRVEGYQSGWDVLHGSLFYGNVYSAIFLLESSLDICSQDKDDGTPIKIAFLDAQM